MYTHIYIQFQSFFFCSCYNAFRHYIESVLLAHTTHYPLGAPRVHFIVHTQSMQPVFKWRNLSNAQRDARRIFRSRKWWQHEHVNKRCIQRKWNRKKMVSFVSSASHCSEIENGNEQKPTNVSMKLILRKNIISKSICSMTICFKWSVHKCMFGRNRKWSIGDRISYTYFFVVLRRTSTDLVLPLPHFRQTQQFGWIFNRNV